MIISASYRTDIPAFYGEWFENRLNAGYCKVANPYGGKPYRVNLGRDSVDGFVFWTKNITPFLDKLELVHERGYPFIVQYTINGYLRTLEFSVVDANRSIQHMRTISEKYGSRTAIWRYDTILFSSLTPFEFHLENFERLATQLEGTTDEVVVSFAQVYRKTLRNMNWAAEKFGFTWFDPDDETKLKLVRELVELAKKHRMQLKVCSQSQYVVTGAEEAKCIDAGRLSLIAGRNIRATVKGNRPDCACFMSRDIGAYDTCPHGCVYCYAVINREKAQQQYHQHDPLSEFLFNTNPQAVESAVQPDVSPDLSVPIQPRLF